MLTPSNSYAEKIYAEHPIGLWSLDDQADYVSLITEQNRDIEAFWSITNGTLFNANNEYSDPFKTSAKTLLKADVPEESGIYTTIVSPDIVNFQDLNFNLGTFAISTYFFSESVYTQEIQMGYEYTDPTTSEIIQNVKSYEVKAYNRWSFISHTFNLPNIDANLRIIFKLRFFTGAGTVEDYKVFFNGITLGQWSEEFNSSSLGLTTISLPSNIALSNSEVIEARSYIPGDESGYYFVSNNSILARNYGIPLVFGASNVTKLVQNNNSPSIIFPGKGFLNQVGQYNDYTVEFWIKVNSNSIEPTRIFGPIASTDGLYVEGGFLTLVIGKNFNSHFIGEWYRPMLIQIRIINNFASLLLNGEEVISFPIITKDLVLPTILNEENKSQDWVGFYANDVVTPFELDCFSIYSYSVPLTVAKRRFAYGQAVLSPEKIDSSYGGRSTYIDYAFSNYSSNYNYPDHGKWEQGSFDNLVINNTTLQTPNYQLPEIYLQNKTLQNLYDDCQIIQDEDYKFITFRPNESWNDVQAYINFPKFNIINDDVHVVYAVVKIDEDDLTEQTIIEIYNTITGNKFYIRKDGSEIHYYLYFNGVEEQIYTTNSFALGELIAVGIDIEGIVETFGGDVATFFGNKNGMKMYIGGDNTGLYTFTGKIYSIGISSSLNETLIENHFTLDGVYGIANLSAGEDLLNHIASYTLTPFEKYSKFFLDISAHSIWQDYLPLSYFAKKVKNSIGEDIDDIDFIQFNIGYPSPTQVLTEGSNEVFDTTGSAVKSYITFQSISDGANLLEENFTTIVKPSEYGVLKVGEYPNWRTSMFEIVDNTVIYPPANIDFNSLAIVYTLKFDAKGISTNKVKLRRLELASQSLNDNSFNPIGTRFGNNIFPYKKSGIYYDYKTENPIAIYKKSTPYLYLTRNSGIEIKEDESIVTERGLSLPINQTQSLNYKINAIQMWLMQDHQTFKSSPEVLFTIDHKEDSIIFYVVANSDNLDRAKIYAKKKSTGKDFNGLAFYLNGRLVTEPVITSREWNSLGITFSNSLNFNSYIGKITLNAPFVYNNIGLYEASRLQEIQSKITRPWFNVKVQGEVSFDWEYWADAFTWEGVLVVGSTEAYGINPEDIFNTYIGENKISIDDSTGLMFNPEKLKIYGSISWYGNVQTPV